MSQSPFYTPIRVNKSDFSAIGRSGQVWQGAFQQAADAISKIGSAYFDRKGYEDFGEDFVHTKEAETLWKKKKLNPFELQAAREDPKKARKMMGDIVAQAGGVEEFEKKMMEQQKMGMLVEEHANAQKLSSLKTEEASLALDALKRQTKEEKQTRKLFAQAFKKNEDTGEVKFDIDQIKTDEKNRYLLPAVYKQFKDMGLLGDFNYSKWKNSLIQNDAWDPSDRQGMAALLDSTVAAYPDMGGEDSRRIRQNLQDDTYEPDEIMASADKWWNQNPNSKTWMEAEETNSRIDTGLKNALAQDESGNYVVKNASTAGFVIRQFARLANGVGVMTNDDVDAVKGASDAQSTWDRLKTRFLGDKIETRQATEEDVRNGFADRVGETINIRLGARATAQDLLMIKDATEAFMKVNQRRLQDHGLELHDYLKNAYTGVPEDRLLALSPFSQYWHKAHRFTMAPKDLGKLNRALDIDGEESVIAALRESNPNLRPSQISAFINMARNYEPPSNDVSVPQQPKEAQSPTDFEPNTGTPAEIDNSNRPDVDSVMPDSLTGKNVIEASIGAVGGKKLINWMQNNYNRGTMLEDLGENSNMYKKAIKGFRDAPMSQIKGLAKDMDVDISKISRRGGKGKDLMIRETLERKFKDRIKERVSDSLAQKGLKKSIAKSLIKVAFSGAVGVAAAAFDIIDIFETKNEVAREELMREAAKYKEGSAERKLVDDLLKEMNYNSGDFKKFKRDSGAGMSGQSDKRTYELYRATVEGI
jgi:hypothetical protein